MIDNSEPEAKNRAMLICFIKKAQAKESIVETSQSKRTEGSFWGLRDTPRMKSERGSM